MKEFDLFGFQVEIDEAATREWYRQADEWDCKCGDCRHFIELAKKQELPIPVLEILEQFGIALEKATYVCEMITEEHEVLYQFSYRIAGNIVKEIKDGAKEFLQNLSETFYIKIFTTRNKILTSKWILENKLENYVQDITDHKDVCWLFIDDRCINFQGNTKI